MKNFVRPLIAALTFLLFLVDSRHTILEAADAMTLCIQTVIPSLFVFIFLSLVLTGQLSGRRLPFLKWLGNLCHMAPGTESILLLGLLGGYPVGAQCIAHHHENGAVSRSEAQRLMAFCSNAGPSFILGAGSVLFTNRSLPWALWGIHIASAIAVGMLLPGRQNYIIKSTNDTAISLPKALDKAVKIMAAICGWVIIFRVIIGFLQRWILWILPAEVQLCITGALELVNGFHEMGEIPGEGARFILASAFLGFGGLCVLMQTKAVAGSLGLGLYLPGKCLQTLLSILLASAVQGIGLPQEQRYIPHPIMLITVTIMAAVLILCLKKQKNGSILRTSVV